MLNSFTPLSIITTVSALLKWQLSTPVESLFSTTSNKQIYLHFTVAVVEHDDKDMLRYFFDYGFTARTI